MFILELVGCFLHVLLICLAILPISFILNVISYKFKTLLYKTPDTTDLTKFLSSYPTVNYYFNTFKISFFFISFVILIDWMSRKAGMSNHILLFSIVCLVFTSLVTMLNFTPETKNIEDIKTYTKTIGDYPNLNVVPYLMWVQNFLKLIGLILFIVLVGKFYKSSGNLFSHSELLMSIIDKVIFFIIIICTLFVVVSVPFSCLVMKLYKSDEKVASLKEVENKLRSQNLTEMFMCFVSELIQLSQQLIVVYLYCYSRAYMY